jgi:hypothetical protein
MVAPQAVQFDILPNEIVSQIVREVMLDEAGPQSLGALRLTNHAFHSLVHQNQAALCRIYLQSNCFLETANALSPVLPHDLAQIMGFARRRSGVVRAADDIARHLTSHIKFRHNPFNDDEMKAWKSSKAENISRTLQPPLFVLYDFCENLRRIISAATDQLAYLTDLEFVTLGEIFDLDQQQMLERLPDEKLTDATQTWRIIVGIAKAKRIEMGPQVNETYPSARSLIADGGLHPLLGLLCEDPKDIPADAVGKILLDVKPQMPLELDLLPSICHLRTQRLLPSRTLAARRRLKTQITFVEQQSIWEKAAFAVMQRKGLVTGREARDEILGRWLRGVMSKKEDPRFHLGRWDRPPP